MSEQIEKKNKTKWYKKAWGIALIILGFFILAFLIDISIHFVYYYREIKNGKVPISGSFNFLKSGKKVAEPKTIDQTKLLPSGEPESSPGAPLTIVGFFDFRCPISSEASLAARELQTAYAGKVNFVFRNFPLADLHPDATLAAQAGECALIQNKFWPMHDKIFANLKQEKITEADLKIYAEQIGLDLKKFTDCLNSAQSKNLVLKDVDDGEALGVAGTPTWFIKNQRVEGAISADLFKKILDKLLSQ